MNTTPIVDFLGRVIAALGIDARVAVELDLESGRALLAQLQEAINQAERAEAG